MGLDLCDEQGYHQRVGSYSYVHTLRAKILLAARVHIANSLITGDCADCSEDVHNPRVADLKGILDLLNEAENHGTYPRFPPANLVREKLAGLLWFNPNPNSYPDHAGTYSTGMVSDIAQMFTTLMPSLKEVLAGDELANPQSYGVVLSLVAFFANAAANKSTVTLC